MDVDTAIGRCIDECSRMCGDDALCMDECVLECLEELMIDK